MVLFLRTLVLSMLLIVIPLTSAEAGGVPLFSTAGIDLSKHLSIFSDSSRSKTILEILALPEADWQKNTQAFIHLGFSDDTIWFKTTIDTHGVIENNWVLRLQDSLKDEVDVFYVRNNLVVRRYKARPSQSFYQRPIKHRNFVFPLNLKPDTTVDIYIRIRYAQHIFMPIKLSTASEFAENDQQSIILQAMFIGLVLTMFFYNLITYIATRDLSYLYYVGITLSGGLYYMSLSGLTYQYLWPYSPEWNSFSHTLFGAGLVVFISLFAIRFLEVRPRSVTYYYFISIALIGCGAAFLPMAGQLLLGAQLATLVGLVCWVSCFVLGVKSWTQGVSYVAYYTIAWFMMLITGTALFLGFLKIIPFSAGLLLASQLAFAVQTVLNSVALAARINSLEFQRQQALADNNAKQAFLAKMSHELRTPMNGILGMVELLVDRLVEPTNQRYIQIIKTSSTTLLTIINDVLDYSKIEAGKMELEEIEFDIRSMIRHCLDVYCTSTLDKPVELVAEIDPTIPKLIISDPTRIGQIVINLVSNALKFTDQGIVIVKLDYEDVDNDLIRISVQDTGRGISEEKQASLFEAFQQADLSTARHHGGTGLGLAICKELVHLMGGELKLHSTVGKGSCFWVTLRLASVGEPPAESEYLSGKSILMVNDHDQLSGELLLLLRRWDIRAIRVPDYISAVTSVRNSEHPFDLVLVEATLGSRDGVEVGGRLRDSGMEAKMVLMYHAAIRNVPTHAITRGFDILEAKPALLNDYEYLFERAFGEKGDGDDSREQGVSYHPVPERSLSILVVEDNSVNQMVIRGLLSKLHHCATLCENGQDAVSVLQDSPDGFDVVLMDCEMPVMDGLTATRLLRDWENSVGHAHIPVIALTAHILKEQLDACRDAGMDDLLTKPIEIKKLEEILLRHVSS